MPMKFTLPPDCSRHFFANGIWIWIQTICRCQIVQWCFFDLPFLNSNPFETKSERKLSNSLSRHYFCYICSVLHWFTLDHTASWRTHPKIMMIMSGLGRPPDMYLNSVVAKQLETTTFLFTPSSVRWELTTNKKPRKKHMKSNPHNEI